LKTYSITNSISNFDQLVSISSPYIDDHKIKIINSKFSQIKSEGDYNKIIVELKEIIAANHAITKPTNNVQ
jgi:hypothetical protein